MRSRQVVLSLCAGLAAALAGSACSRRAESPAQGEALPAAAQGKTTVLATVAEGPGAPGAPAAGGPALHAGTTAGVQEFRFAEGGAGVAWTAETEGGAQVYFNGRAGKTYKAVGDVVFSRDGRRHAFGALVGDAWRMVVDGVEGQPFSAVQDAVFSPDGAHLAYVAMAGERWYVVVDGKANAGTAGRYEAPEFSADSSRIAFIDDKGGQGRGALVVSDLSFARAVVAGKDVSSLTLSDDRTTLAAVTQDGEGQRVITLRFDAPDRVKRGAREPAILGLALSPDGRSVAHLASRGSEAFVVLDGREEPQQFGGVFFMKVRPGGGAVAAWVPEGGGTKLHTYFEPGARDEGPYDEAEGLVYSGDGRSHAYAALREGTWRLVVNGHEGPAFDRVVTPAFPPDGSRVVYRARKDGRRFVVVADLEGRTIRQHPAYEQVFPVVVGADGKTVAYGVKEGRNLAWKEEGL